MSIEMTKNNSNAEMTMDDYRQVAKAVRITGVVLDYVSTVCVAAATTFAIKAIFSSNYASVFKVVGAVGAYICGREVDRSCGNRGSVFAGRIADAYLDRMAKRCGETSTAPAEDDISNPDTGTIEEGNVDE